ncbi:site-specific integrase [Ornithinimicrobium kibberense]|nr:site-specific integrase [Ornithinimicrobium kibberense]
MPKRRAFGQIAKLPSGRYRARYVGPDTVLHSAPTTFESKIDAEMWLAAEHRLIAQDDWVTPKSRRSRVQEARTSTLGEYAERWLQQRELKPRTRDHYRSLLERHILPELGTVPLTRVTSELVREWYMQLDKSRPTLRAHAYGLLRTILGTAVTDGKISSNPCHIRGAGSTERTKQIRPATLTELETITLAMPEKYRPMVLLSSWCALRFGELIELRTKDIDLRDGVIHVRRGVVRTGGQVIVGTPKSAAGSRDVAIPPHLIPVVHDHIERHARGGRDALLFPAADGRSHLAPSTLYRVFYRAREAAGRPDLRWHDLRHTGAVLAAQTGATLAELMARLGHSTPQAALRYQHAAQGRDAQIAQALSRIAIAQSE